MFRSTPFSIKAAAKFLSGPAFVLLTVSAISPALAREPALIVSYDPLPASVARELQARARERTLAPIPVSPPSSPFTKKPVSEKPVSEETASKKASTEQVSAAAPRPLAKIRFASADVNYQQPLNAAIADAKTKFPDARYEIVSVYPSKGNAAQVAIESNKARRHGEKIMASMTGMGVGADRIMSSVAPSKDATVSEVQVYIR